MYLWLLAFHIICVMAWMAGMLYLPRLYVYHAGLAPGSEASELFKTMEKRLLRYIINPAMIGAWILGLTLMVETKAYADGWCHAKLSLLVIMQILHALFARQRRHFEQDRNQKSAKFYRCINEAVTVLMIAIVILAVVKPF